MTSVLDVLTDVQRWTRHWHIPEVEGFRKLFSSEIKSDMAHAQWCHKVESGDDCGTAKKQQQHNRHSTEEKDNYDDNDDEDDDLVEVNDNGGMDVGLRMRRRMVWLAEEMLPTTITTMITSPVGYKVQATFKSSRLVEDLKSLNLCKLGGLQ
jgi:hypothetical protein